MIVLYVSRPQKELLSRDPVLATLPDAKTNILEVARGAWDDDVLEWIDRQIEVVSEDEGVCIILDAFLGTAPGAFKPGLQWDLEDAALDKLLDRASLWEANGECLMSLRLVWKLWARLGGRARLLVTTNEVEVSPYTRLALADAYAEGRLCYLYHWGINKLERERMGMMTNVVMRQRGGIHDS